MAIVEVMWVEVYKVHYHEGTKGIPAASIQVADVDTSKRFEIAIPLKNLPRLITALTDCWRANKDRPEKPYDPERPKHQIVRPGYLKGDRLRVPGGPVVLGVEGHDGYERRRTNKATFEFPEGAFAVPPVTKKKKG